MSDFVLGGITFDSEKVFPKAGNTRADDVAKIYREAIEYGVKEGAEYFIANNININKETGKDNEFDDGRGGKFTINHGTQQKAIDKLNNDPTFPYILEKDNKKAKGGSKKGYKIRKKTDEEIKNLTKDNPAPTTPTTPARNRSPKKTTKTDTNKDK